MAGTDYQIRWLIGGRARKMEMGRRRHVGKDESALGALEWQMETARLRFRHPINPTSPSPVSHTSSLARPIPLTTSGAGPHPGPGMDSTPAWIGREAASVCLLLTFNQQSPNYCSARVRTSDVIAIFPLFSRSAVHTVLGEEEDHGQSGFKRSTWTRIFVFLNWYVLYYIIRKLSNYVWKLRTRIF